MPAALFGDLLRHRAPAIGDEVIDDIVDDGPDEDEVLLVFEFGRGDELEARYAKLDRRGRDLLEQLGEQRDQELVDDDRHDDQEASV